MFQNVSLIVDTLYIDELIPVIHYNFFDKHLYDLYNIFSKHKWFIGINQTNISFYTSDHPIATIPYLETGYSSKGVEIIFPINPKIVLIIREKSHFKNNKGNGKLVNLTENEVEEYNKAQIYSSNRFIYSKDDNFDLINKFFN